MIVSTANVIRHNFNALHVYGKLIDFGLPKNWAQKISRSYEKVFHRILYKKYL
jgi:hypothetical protein